MSLGSADTRAARSRACRSPSHKYLSCHSTAGSSAGAAAFSAAPAQTATAKSANPFIADSVARKLSS